MNAEAEKHQRIGAQDLFNGGKGVVKLALIADLEDMNLLAERSLRHHGGLSLGPHWLDRSGPPTAAIHRRFRAAVPVASPSNSALKKVTPVALPPGLVEAGHKAEANLGRCPSRTQLELSRLPFWPQSLGKYPRL